MTFKVGEGYIYRFEVQLLTMRIVRAVTFHVREKQGSIGLKVKYGSRKK
jgi:hypothetical protein